MNPPRTTSQPEPLVTQEPTNESLTGELSHYKTQLAAIERVSQTLFQSINLDELVETTLRIALEEVDGEAGSILLADPETQQLVFQYSIGEKPVPRGTAIAWDSGISGAVFQSGLPRLTTCTDEQAGHNSQIDRATGFTTREMITVPLRRWRSEPIGVMNVLNKRTGQLNKQDLALLSIISAFAAVAIQQRSGGNLGEVLTRLSKLLRDRAKLQAKAKALSSEGRYSGLFLSAIPFIMFGVVTLFNPDYYGQVRNNPIVAPILVATFVWMLLGSFVINRMVNFKP